MNDNYDCPVVTTTAVMLLRCLQTRDRSEVEVMMATLHLLLQYAKPLCGGVLEDESAFYLGFVLHDSIKCPPLMTDDDSEMNTSNVVIRTIDLPFAEDQGIKVRCYMVAFDKPSCDFAEQKMRAGVERMRSQASTK